MGGSRGGERGSGPPSPLKNHQNIGFLSKTGPDRLKNHKATKPAFNVGSPSARQRNAIKMAFRWWADDGSLWVVLGPLSLSVSKKTKQKKNTLSELDPLWQNFWIRPWSKQLLHTYLIMQIFFLVKVQMYCFTKMNYEAYFFYSNDLHIRKWVL